MDAFDAFVPHFRRAQERWPDAPTLASHYRAVVESYEGSGLDIIAPSKSFIECVCRIIIAGVRQTRTSIRFKHDLLAR